MASIALLVPREEMIVQAKELAEVYPLDLNEIRVIETENAVEQAKQAVENGAEIIIARGTQASYIKNAMDIPVVEIILTGQEMGFLVSKAKQISGRSRPQIAVIGFPNMFCDMKSFDELYGITLCEYFIAESDKLCPTVDRAAEEGADIVIGGDAVCARAEEIGLKSLFLTSGKESIADAFRVAEKVAYAKDEEKKNTAELKTLLDYSFNGIIKTDAQGRIVHWNHFIENLVNQEDKNLRGCFLTSLIPAISEEMLESVLKRGNEIYSTILVIEKNAMVTNIAPICIGSQIEGAIVSFHEGKRIEKMEEQMRRGLYEKGQVAKNTFDNMIGFSEASRKLWESAKAYAKFGAPMLITGEKGTGKDQLAQCIHNASVYSERPFISIHCESFPPEQLCLEIFGQEKHGKTESNQKGLIDLAEGGTFFIDEVGKLNDSAQYKLYNLVSKNVLIRNGNNRPLPAHVRVIAANSGSLIPMVRQGTFREELYYVLSVLTLETLPLRERREDIPALTDRYIELYQKKYSRFIRLTHGARQMLADYSWDGNLIQLKSFCERLVVTAPRRMVDEMFISKQLDAVYPVVCRQKGDQVIVYKDPRAAELAELLEKYEGNRSIVAEKLNISKTTLWRHMKKYGISSKYEA